MKLQFDEDMLLVPEEDGTLKIRSFSGSERKIHFLDNSYRKNNQQMFDKIVSLILSQPKYYHWKIKQSKEIPDWIDLSVPDLRDPVYKLSTKIFWILDDIESFDDKRVRCLNDDKPFIGVNVGSVFGGYLHEFCCCKCAASFQRTKERKVEGCLRTMGVTNSMKCRKTVEKMQDNFMKNHGVKSPMQHPEFKRRYNDSMLSTYGVEWSMQCPEILSAARQTTFEHYGVFFPLQSDECKQHAVDTMLDRYGVPYPMQSPEIYQKMLDSTKKNFGVDLSVAITNIAQIPQITQKISDTLNSRTDEEVRERTGKYTKTCNDRYGVDNPMQLSATIEKSQQTCFEHYGARSPAQVPEIQAKMHKKYEFDGNVFDSSDELVYYIWLKDNGIEFKFHPNTHFLYEVDGKDFAYFPDFFINAKSEYVEVKGDHFFKEDGTMFCPYRDPQWSDEDYAQKCRKYEAKRQCMLANGVRILLSSSSEICAARDFVRYAYGPKFIGGCRVKETIDGRNDRKKP